MTSHRAEKPPAEPLPKPAWNWPTVIGFVVALIGLVVAPYVFGPAGLLLAAIGTKRATSDPVRFNSTVAVVVLVVALFVCFKAMTVVGDWLMR